MHAPYPPPHTTCTPLTRPLHAPYTTLTRPLTRPLTTPYDPLRPPTRPSQTYERRAIEQWLAGERERGAVPVSPLTGEPLKDTTLRPNFLARELGWVAGPE